MKKLIIITGMTGTGKSTIADQLGKAISDLIIISKDKIEENLADIVGFKNSKQRESLRFLSNNVFIELLDECMKRQDTVLVEYPFHCSWFNDFYELIAKHDYDVLTIKVYQLSADDIWNSLTQRTIDGTRHTLHYVNSYNPKDLTTSEPRQGKTREDIQKSFDEETYTKTVYGKAIKFTTKHDDIKDLIEAVVNFMNK